MSARAVRIFPDADSLAREAAARILRQTRASSGRFTMALSGGSTPRRLYEELGARGEPAGDGVHLFWGDERWVPRDDPRSNYRLAQEAWLGSTAIPAQNVHPVPTQAGSAEEGARLYEEAVRRFFALEGNERPRFDLVLLGLGTDGHTASLFPGAAALSERERLVVATHPDGGPDRVTMTLPVLDAAAAVLFLVTGEAKAEVVGRVLEGEPTKELPATLVRPRQGELVWYLDRPAASRLSLKKGDSYRIE